MNNDLQKMIQQAIAVKAATAPINSWKNLYQEPSLKTMRINKLLASGVGETMSNILKASSPLGSIGQYNDTVHNRTIKGMNLMNSPLWAFTDSILANQRIISSAIAKSATALDAFDKTRVANRTIIGLGSFFETTFPIRYSTKLASLDSALKGLSEQITFRGNIEPDAEFLERFATATQKAAAITEDFTEKSHITIEDLKNLETFVGEQIEEFTNRINEKIEKTAKSSFAMLNLWVAIVGILLTLFTIYQTYQSQQEPKENAATKEDVQKAMQYVDERFKEALSQVSITAKTRVLCHLRNKASSNSKCLFCIKPGELVHIIESNHKWVRITVIDSSDNLPISGWVMRKHLIRK